MHVLNNDIQFNRNEATGWAKKRTRRGIEQSTYIIGQSI